MSDLLERLRGTYRIPIDDGAGPLDGKTEFARTFAMPPICNEAADLIEQQAAEIERLRARVERLEEELGDMIGLAREAMEAANTPQASYKIAAELEDAEAALQESE